MAYLEIDEDTKAEGAIRLRSLKVSASKTPTAPSENPVYNSMPSHEYIALEIAAERDSLGDHCKKVKSMNQY